MFRLFRSRLLWLTIGVLTLSGAAFWIVVAVVAAVLAAAGGGVHPDPEGLVQVAVPIGMLAALATAILGIVTVVVVRRGQARRWVPLREQMVRDAATLPDTHLAQIVSSADAAAGGQVLARDLITGHQMPLWLPGWNPPRGAVLCFTATPSGPRGRAWMIGRLWWATSRETARMERRIARVYTVAGREQHDAAEGQIRDAADEAIVEAERILREHNPG